jgi:hypothetical protein
MVAELVDVVGVRVDGRLSEVPQLHALSHAANKLIHAMLIRRHCSSPS